MIYCGLLRIKIFPVRFDIWIWYQKTAHRFPYDAHYSNITLLAAAIFARRFKAEWTTTTSCPVPGPYSRWCVRKKVLGILRVCQPRWASRPSIYRDKLWKVLLQINLDLFCSLRLRRVLNEHNLVKFVVFTNPGEKNINKDPKLLPFFHFKTSFNEMRKHHLTSTCNSCENHYWSWIFASHHGSNVWRVTSNNSSVLAAYNIIHNNFFLINYYGNVSSLWWDGWEASGSWAGSKVFISRSSLIALMMVLC